MGYKNPADSVTYHARYYEEHKPQILSQQHDYAADRRSGSDGDHVRALSAARNRKWWARSPKSHERNRRYMKARTQALRAELLDVFGHRCACCGETAAPFLTLDHIGGGGKAHRKPVGNAAWAVLSSVKKMGWPKDKFRLLCMNCNFATRGGKPCPHTTEHVERLLVEAFCS